MSAADTLRIRVSNLTKASYRPAGPRAWTAMQVDSTHAWRTAGRMLADNAGPADLYAGFTWDPPAIASGAGATSAAIPVPGAAIGDPVSVMPPGDLLGLAATAYVSAPASAKIQLVNATGAAVDLPAGLWRVRVKKSFD